MLLRLMREVLHCFGSSEKVNVKSSLNENLLVSKLLYHTTCCTEVAVQLDFGLLKTMHNSLKYAIVHLAWLIKNIV